MADQKPEHVADSRDIEENRYIAILSYINILCFIPLLLKKDSPYAQFHAKQGLSLFIVETVAWLLVMTVILSWLGGIVLIICVVASLYGIMNVLNGKMIRIPGVDMLARKLNL